MITQQAVPCSICASPAPPIPYGPSDAPCCAPCWFEAGSYAAARLRAFGPQVGDCVKYRDALGIELWAEVREVDWERRVVLVGPGFCEEEVPWTWLLRVD